jgi:hypothetical protein
MDVHDYLVKILKKTSNGNRVVMQQQLPTKLKNQASTIAFLCALCAHRFQEFIPCKANILHHIIIGLHVDGQHVSKATINFDFNCMLPLFR